MRRYTKEECGEMMPVPLLSCLFWFGLISLLCLSLGRTGLLSVSTLGTGVLCFLGYIRLVLFAGSN
jgi:hypothetical protein